VVEEDNGFGPGMMFGIPGPGPKKDTKGIPSDKTKELGVEVKNMKKSFLKFKEFTSKKN
jgi:hypothetical protein